MGIVNFLKRVWNAPPRHRISKRRYDGAQRGRLNADWVTWGSSANSEIYNSLRTLRSRSRDLLRNNDYARGIVRSIVNNVVFTGIGFQAQVKQLKNKKRNDDVINAAIETAWDYWSQAKYCDTSGGNSFAELQQLATRSFIESGEVFVRKVRSSFGGCEIPFALELIEADQCADDYSCMHHNGNEIVMGVELDKWKRPVAYWMYTDHPGDFLFGTTNRLGTGSRNLERIPASEIIHLFIKERPNQVRGVPWLYSAITRLRNLGEYEKSELIASRAAAAIMGIVTSADAAILGEPILDDEGNEINQQLPADEELSPGMLRYLAPGESFTGFAPNRPNAAFSSFFESQLRGTGAGVGVSYENVSNDYSKSNYSSSRLSLLQARDVWKVLQGWFICHFNREVYAEWLDMAVLSGYLRFSDYELRCDRYHEIRWTPRGWSWVDPYKEIQATIAAVKSGLTTLTEEIAKQGGDFEETVKTIAREREILERYNVSLSFDGYSVHQDDEALKTNNNENGNGNGNGKMITNGRFIN